MRPAVFGRESVLVAVDHLLASAQRGLAALVLEGDPGIGKTTIWREGIARATDKGYRVLSCRATATEARLSFAALGDLLASIELALFDSLPDPQRRGLEAALLRAESRDGAPNPRAIGTGITTLLRALADASPVLVAIDDLPWVDTPSARVLEFALRRLEAHRIALLATVRLSDRGAGSGLLSTHLGDRVSHVRVGPVSLAALYRIIEQKLGRGFPRPLLISIERACGGNPFYALEIARAIEPSEGPAHGSALPIPDDLRELVAGRLRNLPRRTRDALLRVSALAQPTTALVDSADLGPAEEEGVVRIGDDGRIEFAQPLFAVAVYAAASHERRRKLHGELADLAEDVEERARHLMLAREGDECDEALADLLDDAAEHALHRGAVEVAADLEEQSARHTPARHDDRRWQRLLRSARHYLKAGDPARSRTLCQAVLNSALPPSQRAHALALLAEGRRTERPDAAIPLLEEALACAGDDTAQAAQLEISLGGVLLSAGQMVQADEHLARAVELAERSGVAALIADALALKEFSAIFVGKGVDQESLDRALALEDLDREVGFQLRASFNVAQANTFIGNLDVARQLLGNLRDRLVVRGEEADLAWVLIQLAMVDVLAGRLESAERGASEAERVAVLTGVEVFRALGLMVQGWVKAIRGDSGGSRAACTEVLAVAERIGWPHGVSESLFVLGFLSLSEGDPKTAVATLEPVVAGVESIGIYEWPIAVAVPDAIEALVATDDVERASRLAGAFSDWGRRFDRPWVLATSARCRALVAAATGDLDGAEASAAQALVEHRRLPMPFELGRTLLVHGQLQRRRGARRAGRETLQRALGIFEDLGARLWADMARREIARIGVRRAPAELTESERRVAEMAAQGLKNPEIAARLFMSRRTVEANLSRVYQKLGIRSRAQLSAAMSKARSGPGQ